MDAQTGGFITCLLCGLLVAVTGVYMLVTGNPSIMHGYHYATTLLSQRAALARWSGAGMLMAGIGCAFIVPPAGLPDWLGIAGILVLIAGLGVTFGSIVHFNGSLISFSAADATKSKASRPLAIALGMLIAIIVAAATVIPGALMIASGDPSALHGYHLSHVAEADRPALAAWVGAGTIALGLGLGMAIAGGFCGSRRPMPTWAKVLLGVGLAGFAAGLAVTLGAIIHFNGSLTG